MAVSWLSRHLKNRKSGGGSGHKPKSEGPFQGINDFSELAAVLDYYEVRKRPDEQHVSTTTVVVYSAVELFSYQRQAFRRKESLPNAAHALFLFHRVWAFDALSRWRCDDVAGRRSLRRNGSESVPEDLHHMLCDGPNGGGRPSHQSHGNFSFDTGMSVERH